MREKMKREVRAKQFLPFSAVKGLEEALERKRQELLFEKKIILSQDSEAEIDSILKALTVGMVVSVNYYDSWYNTSITGIVNSINMEQNFLVIDDKIINFDLISYISINEGL